MRAIIIGGGSVSKNLKEYILPGDFIVCADSGYDRAKRLGIVPDLVIGDMDSIVSSVESGPEIITAPVQKDETDSMLCVDTLAERGYDEILLFGALGGRPDHSFANITLLLYAAKKGIHLEIVHEMSHMFIIDSRTEISGKKGDTFSLFALGGDACGITTKGLLYPLSDETLYADNPRGVSNELLENNIAVSVKNGYLLAIHIKGGEKNEQH
ncbi:MAG: thiamine diphosphokinase [Clostridia bacterium]|nr:thiamine diphosphokinase [Clostridia bacterium]